MSDRNLDDETRQKKLLGQVSFQLIGIGKLIFAILLFVSPFFGLYIIEYYYPEIAPDVLLTFWGIAIPLVTAIGYLFIKKAYVGIQQNR